MVVKVEILQGERGNPNYLKLQWLFFRCSNWRGQGIILSKEEERLLGILQITLCQTTPLARVGPEKL